MIWRYLVRPILFRLPAEGIHRLSMALFNSAMRPPMAHWVHKRYQVLDGRLKNTVMGIDFENPVGLAAGFDKHAAWFNSLARLGFSHIEIGTITGQEQPGNPKPRLFRLSRDRALVNRMGFNNPGASKIADQLQDRQILPVLGINIGRTKNVANEQAVADYLFSFEKLFPFAAYFTVNVSSPNTPDLRKLQDRQPLSELLSSLVTRNVELSTDAGCSRKPILLKIAPDLSPAQLDDVMAIVSETAIDGLIATNTTTQRSGLLSAQGRMRRAGDGGLSGAPLTALSREMIRALYRGLGGKVPLIGVGGIMDGEDAWQMILAGASLVQIYTGFVYGGPGIVRDINRHLQARLDECGLAHIAEAVGSET